jgi:hypothetical protein
MKNGFIITKRGTKCHYLNDKFHRDDGPAVEYADGSKCWCQNGKYHREDGPAIEWNDGVKEWYFHGKEINCKSQKEFEEYIKLAMFW